ncbi:hypothetical protein ACVWZK_005135 [Bradyrhizobium sp. GM0.4]
MSTGIHDFFKDFAAPIATVIAASAAAFVAYRLGRAQADAARIQAQVAKSNWQTANERVVLDLFERRISIFEGIRAVIATIVQTGQPSEQDYNDYCRALDRVPFYFGKELQTYLEQLRLTIIGLQAANQSLKYHLLNDEMSDKRQQRMSDLNDFYKKGFDLFAPYIQAHQKAGPWPGET